jgi:putative endonuclease
MGHPDKRQKANHKGFVAEYFAAILLIIKGYRICNMRYRTKLGEIDIIARKGDLAIFVEVKARKTVPLGVDAVTHTAQNRIRAASDLWLQKQSRALYFSQRYDIIVVTPWRLPHHFIDAF